MIDNFAEVFEVELKCWCIGLERVTERVDRSVLHKVIKEFAPVLREAIENSYVFDILETASRLVTSAKCRGAEKETIYYILSHLPAPAELDRKQAAVLMKIVDQVEKSHGGAIKRLEKKWAAATNPNWSAKKTNSQSLFGNLSFPSKA